MYCSSSSSSFSRNPIHQPKCVVVTILPYPVVVGVVHHQILLYSVQCAVWCDVTLTKLSNNWLYINRSCLSSHLVSSLGRRRRRRFCSFYKFVLWSPCYLLSRLFLTAQQLQLQQLLLLLFIRVMNIVSAVHYYYLLFIKIIVALLSSSCECWNVFMNEYEITVVFGAWCDASVPLLYYSYYLLVMLLHTWRWWWWWSHATRICMVDWFSAALTLLMLQLMSFWRVKSA